MKYRQIIGIHNWVNGSGYSSTTPYEDNVVEYADKELDVEPDWYWWIESIDREQLKAKLESKSSDDVYITVSVYSLDDENLESPIITWGKWESEILEDNRDYILGV